MSMPSAQVPLRPARDINDRGETVLARRVLEKTASQVARDETFAGGSSGGFLGIGVRADLSARPDASVQLAGNIASLKVTVGLPYPVPLRQATEQLRRRITERVTALTGVQVRQVDITVAWLRPPQSEPRRRKLQ
ncbi:MULTISPECIES: Asp23/Gls24 family envelope stress response protein [unclassified Arthrobacter]|uniref:Asp23/Gls24 family envelope stress response protein n=1 Tax=unclassified Arthrobacter TaxID=235627 RepID=UPI001D14C5D7|nr:MULTISPECIES: Asp23/Gls24 family envelope stress response protein [unclassified Arthrobacter]MCC3275459.1 Asp23/Gls24 family envelope stress response protein [Arthrobacter sp. zg-Y20]MCC9176900.1 Asp23/Gls24 family envelope stress response protein [Arthrobacter sp. zg-Y750]MDK1315616.1 Asp23/Gls24 family envelope stress response protein [Arthrobacter sp. zg.Y20]WIB06030.1 Asp23/Gls24 family envelope stress response protein [Arthrobacter sp. zg-Y20]